MRKLFVVGCPRSGTTMLQQVLTRHPGVAIPPETAFFSDFVGRARLRQVHRIRCINADLKIDLPLPQARVTDDEQVRRIYEQMSERYLDRIGRFDALYFGEKTPRHIEHLPKILQLFPDAKVLLIYRDGRSVALSLTKVPWRCSDLYYNFSSWLDYVRLQREIERREYPNLRTVKYEDLVARPDEQARRLAEFLELPFERQMIEGGGDQDAVPAWERGWKARAFESVSEARVNVWRDELSGEQVARIERWGRDELTSLGYELSSGGTGRLPWTFFAHLYWTELKWKARVALRLGKMAVGASKGRDTDESGVKGDP